MNTKDILDIRTRLNNMFERRARACVRLDDGSRTEQEHTGDNKIIAVLDKEIGRVMRENFPAVTMEFPGLYPLFTVNGYQELSVETMITSYLNLPRNYFVNKD